MERLQQGPDTFFRISPSQRGESQYLAVKYNEIDKFSLGVSFYASELQRLLRGLRRHPKAKKPLMEYVDVNPNVDLHEMKPEDCVSFIPMESVSTDATGEYTTSIKQLHEVRQGYTHFKNRDILWAKITPSMQNGKSCIVDGLTNGVGFGSTEFHVLRVQDNEISPEFVFEFVSQETLRRVATYVFTGSAGQQRVPATFLENLPFPKLSSSHQNELVLKMDVARAERKAKLAKADTLLDGISDFVLDALDIESPPTDSRKVFAVNSVDIRKGGILTSDYYHPERMLALRALEDISDRLVTVSLDEVVSFEREQIKTPGKNYLGLAHIQSDTGELTDSEDIAKGTCFTYQTNDVLFARLRPYLNKVYRAEMDGCCSTEFHVLRVSDRESLSPDYLAAVLRTRIVLAQTVHMMTGNTHPRLTNDDVANLRIPIPMIEVQNVITTEVRRRREEARRLQSEAEYSWQDAKRWFEEQLLR